MVEGESRSPVPEPLMRGGLSRFGCEEIDGPTDRLCAIPKYSTVAVMSPQKESGCTLLG